MTRTAPHNRKLAKLADLQALTSQSQANDISQQDSDMRALQTLYGISQDQTMSPEKVRSLQLANEAAGYKNDWFNTQAGQQHELGQVALDRAPYDIQALQGQIANMPLQGALMGAQANHLTTDSAETNARLTAGEPAAKVNLMNSQAKFAALGPTLGYYAATSTNPLAKPPQFIQDLGDAMALPKDPYTGDMELARALGESKMKNQQLQQAILSNAPAAPGVPVPQKPINTRHAFTSPLLF